MKPIGKFLKIYVPIALVLVAFFVSGIVSVQASTNQAPTNDNYVGGEFSTLPLTPAVGTMIALILAAISAGIILVATKTKIQ